jgi:hypothetical protein
VAADSVSELAETVAVEPTDSDVVFDRSLLPHPAARVARTMAKTVMGIGRDMCSS